MSLAATPVRPMTIEEWRERYGDVEGGRCELVHGHAIMTLTEATQNGQAAFRLTMLLGPRVQHRWTLIAHPSVTIGPDPAASVRVPDLAALRASSVGREWRVDPADVALVVEVVSPSSVETDWATKRAEYAAAGIPHYLIVDVRDPEAPGLWLFALPRTDEPSQNHGPSEPTTYPPYPDPTGDGTSVTIGLPGCDPITITAPELA